MAGTGHLMNFSEFCLEVQQYDQYCAVPVCQERATKKCSRCRYQVAWYCSKEHQKQHWPTHRKDCGSTRVEDGTVYVGTAYVKTNVPFMDFSDKPTDFEIKPYERARCDSIFPHGKPGNHWKIPEIRSGDHVRVCAYKYVPAAGWTASERLWVLAVAVTNTGIVVGISVNRIENHFLRALNYPPDTVPDPKFDLDRGDPVSFPVTCVIVVEHGENW